MLMMMVMVGVDWGAVVVVGWVGRVDWGVDWHVHEWIEPSTVVLAIARAPWTYHEGSWRCVASPRGVALCCKNNIKKNSISIIIFNFVGES